MNEMVKEKTNKKTIILLIVFLIVGFIAGIVVSEIVDIRDNCKQEDREISILNKEIDNCIDRLNQQTATSNVEDFNFS